MSYTAEVKIEITRSGPHMWKSRASVYEHQPRTNRQGRQLSRYSPSIGWTHIEGTPRYSYAYSKGEAVWLAVDAVRSYVRHTKQEHAAYRKRLTKTNQWKEEYTRGVAIALYPDRASLVDKLGHSHKLQTKLGQLLSDAKLNELDKKRDLERSFSPYSLAYQVVQLWKDWDAQSQGGKNAGQSV